MKKTISIFLTVALLLALAWSPSVFAFKDLKDDPAEKAVNDLHKDGIVSGIDKDTFAPNRTLTYAQGVHLIVKGLKLNIDHIRFIKEPVASDYFTKVPNDAWYAQSFIIAHLNGLPLDKDVDPNAALTREAYTHLLFRAVLTKGEFAFIKMLIEIKDNDEITAEYQGSIQYALLAGIAKLDKEQKFYPKRNITRGEAAVMLHAAIKFVKENKPVEQPNDQVTVTTDKAADGVNKVTISWGEKPNPGYRVTIDRIEFADGKEAIVYYSLHEPDPDRVYAQVITEAKAHTYVDSSLKVTVKNSAGATRHRSSETNEAPAVKAS